MEINKLEAIKEAELKWLGIDLDRTVANNSAYPEYKLLKPIKGAKKALKKLTKDGWKIVIHTSRPWNDYSLIENWLNKNKIPFKRIVCGKLFAKWLIDDRGIEFRGNWEEVVKKIN